MAVLQGGGQNLPPHVCVIQKTPCGIGLKKCDCTIYMNMNKKDHITTLTQKELKDKII